MKFPVNSLLAGNLRTSETGSLETASSSEESANHRSLSGGGGDRGEQLVELFNFEK